jgi:hypothetical protein
MSLTGKIQPKKKEMPRLELETLGLLDLRANQLRHTSVDQFEF